MHAELTKLLDLQDKDDAVAEAAQRVDAVQHELRALDAALAAARTAASTARQAATDSVRRRNELEKRIEEYRTAQQRRQDRVDQVRNAKEASAVMAELEQAGAVLAKDEAEWMRSAELVDQRELAAREREAELAAAEAAQRPERDQLDSRREEMAQAHKAAVAAREASAAHVERTLRLRYERLRGSRRAAVVVPLVGSTCGACFTAVPLNRRTRIRSGEAIDGCEGCGAILYPSKAG